MLKFHYEQDQMQFVDQANKHPELIRLVMLGVLKKDKPRTAIVTDEGYQADTGGRVFSVVVNDMEGVQLANYDIVFNRQAQMYRYQRFVRG